MDIRTSTDVDPAQCRSSEGRSPEANGRLAIGVAIIGVIGTLGAALIGNWDKLVSTAKQPEPSFERTVNIQGFWRDSVYPSNTSQIIQTGSSFQFWRRGALLDGTQFESSGSGTITERQLTSTYQAKYQSGATSAGDCSGTVSLDERRMELICSDSRLGTISVTSIRQ